MTPAEFFDLLWGGQEGFAHLAFGHGPHFAPGGRYEHSRWEPRVFAWPAERDYLLKLADAVAPNQDVYHGVLLRSGKTRNKGDGALPGRYAWCDADGQWTADRQTAWDDLARTAGGSLLVGSGRGRHVYAALGGSALPPAEVEMWNRRLTVFFDADSKWAENTVLRPPGTLNHKPAASGEGTPAPVVLLEVAVGPRAPLEALDALLPPDPAPMPAPGSTVLLDLAEVDLSDLPEPVAALVAEEPGEDRSQQTWRFVNALVRAEMDNDRIVAVALHHKPTVAKYGTGRRFAEELGRVIAKARDANDPSWAGGTSESASTGTRTTGGSPAAKEPPLVLPPPKNPLAVARIIVDQNYRRDSHLVLRYWRGTFHRWHGAHWAELEDGAVRSDLYATLGRAVCKGAKGKEPWQPTRHKVTDVLDALRAHVHLAEAVEAPVWLGISDRPPAAELVAVRNGLLHIPTRTLLDHDPRLFNRVSVDLDYDPDAPTPERWLEFLGELWPRDDDADSASTLCEYLGYCISGDTSLHKALLMVGPGRAGKGVVARVATALMGRRNVVGPTLASLGQNFGLSPLVGKPLAVISDARLGQGSNLVVERLLSITGEDALTVDRKYREPWTGKLPTRFVVISNELPRFGDSSRAVARRFIVLMLHRSWLGRENPKLTGELLTELPGILNWALAGLERLQERGYFVEPAGSAEAVLALEDLASPVAAFVRDRCEVDARREVPVDELYKAWRRWCEEEGRDRPGTAQVFGRDLRAVVPTLRIVQPREGDGRRRHYQGIALVPEVDRSCHTHNGEQCVPPRATPLERGGTHKDPLLVYDGREDPEVVAARRYLDDQELLG